MKKIIIISVAAFLVFSSIYFSAFTVSEKEWVIVTQFGNPVETIEDAGLYYKRPGFLQKVNRFDKRIRMFETLPIQLLLGDKNPIIISCYIAWKIKDPVTFFQSVGCDDKNSEQKLSDMVNSQLGIVLGDYKIKNIINTKIGEVKLSEIEKKIQQNSNKSAEEKYGIKVIKIGFERIAYPSVVMRAVYERMQSERYKEAEKLRAEGKESAEKIRSDAQKEAASIKAEAEKAALIIKGEGDKKAMQVYSQAFSKDPEFFDFMNSLEMYKKVLNKDTTFIISSKSELFKYLELGKGKGK